MAKGGQTVRGGFGNPSVDQTNHWHRRLLRPRHERPRGYAAKKRHEIPPPCRTGKKHSEGQRGFGHDRFAGNQKPTAVLQWHTWLCIAKGMSRDRRASVGNSSAFSALAPSQRPMYDAHQPKIFESGISIMSPGPNTWTLNIQPLDQFRPHRGRSTLSNTVACLLHTAR